MANQKAVQDILFEYLKNIIYAPENAHLDLDDLPDDFQDLGEGLLFLGTCVKEQKTFSKSLIKGDFDHNIPSVENGIAAPLKEIHGLLKHLVWQSQEVAQGDYSQRLDYFGKLSTSFNSMVDQLRERENNLRQKNRELMHLQEMFKSITVEAPYYIFSIQCETGSINYLNKKAETLKNTSPLLYQKIYERLADCKGDTTITIDDKTVVSQTNHYQVMATQDYETGNALYIVINVTEEFSRTLELKRIAYIDELTGLQNRRYGQDVMQKLVAENRDFAIAFIDIDHLKYCNDVFGHECGDDYIVEVSSFLTSLSKDQTVCRVGGDEFVLIRPGQDKLTLEQELSENYQYFIHTCNDLFRKSFSFGIAEYRAHQPRDISDILEEADKNMYHYKLKHKQKINYSDTRN